MAEHERYLSSVDPVVLDSAHKHGISDADMLHAYRNAMKRFELDEGFAMIIGGTEDGEMLEVGFVVRGGLTLIIHAMRARSKFLREGD